MNNILSLLKIEFSKSFSKNSMKQNKAKSISFLGIVGLVVILGIVLSSLYSYIYGQIFIEAAKQQEIELSRAIVPLVILFSSVASMLTFFSGLTQSRGILIGHDYDMLVSLPIRKRDIIASKVINLYLVELLYSSIIMIPHGIVVSILVNNGMFVLIGILLAIFISALPLVFSILFAFISSLIADKFKYGNIVSIILYAVFIGAIFSVSFMTSSSKSSQDMAMAFTTASNISKWINPSIIFVEMALYDNLLYLLVFIGISIASLVLVTLVLSLFYDKLHEMIHSVKANYKYERKELKSKKELKALFGIEVRRLVSSKMYFLNSVAGLIMSVLMTVLMSMMFSRYSPFSPNEEFLKLIHDYAFIGGIVIMFGIGISNTCSVAISIEGQNFWLVKTLPINYKKYMWAKLLLALVISVPISLICSTVMVVFLLPDWSSIIAIYLIPILFVCVTILISLLINLTYYKLKWKSEQEVVKNSMAVVLSMFVGFGIEIVLSGVLFGLGIVNAILAIFLSIGILLVALIVFYIILSSVFVKKMNKIEEF